MDEAGEDKSGVKFKGQLIYKQYTYGMLVEQ